jgi:hypothetical protein
MLTKRPSLAWLEMRLLLSKLLWHYDITMCVESKDWMNQRSYLTWEKGPLMAVFTPLRGPAMEEVNV